MPRLLMLWASLRSVGAGIAQHWALAGFSLVAAFGVWFVVQDVENPQVQGFIPADPAPPSIRITKVFNAGDYIYAEPNPVKVKVEARKADFASLQPADFEASVDVKGQAVGTPVSVRVDVKTSRPGVRILEVSPATVTVTLQQAKVKDLPVTVHITAPLPDNYRVSDPQPTVDPATVRVRGLPDDVDSVATVDLDANLSGARNDTVTISNDLVARTDAGNPVSVQITPARATATFKIQQTFVQGTIGITPSIQGQPAKGYRIANVTIDPPVVTLSGPKSVIDGVQSISTDAVNVTNAQTNITQVRNVDRIPNVSADHPTVLVTVEIRPIDCGDQSTACSNTTFIVAPTFTGTPNGLQIVTSDGGYSVQVRVSGPLSAVAALKLSDIKATVSLSNGAAGTQPYTVSFANLPAGVKADADPLPVTLKQAGAP